MSLRMTAEIFYKISFDFTQKLLLEDFSFQEKLQYEPESLECKDH